MLTLMCPKDSHKLCLYRPNNGQTWKKGVVHLKMLQYSDLSSLWHCLMYVLISIIIVCFVWTWRLFTSFCFLQELLWRSLIHAFASLHRQEPKKEKSTCMKWIPLFNYLYTYNPIIYITTIKENYYYLDTEFASSWRLC